MHNVKPSTPHVLVAIGIAVRTTDVKTAVGRVHGLLMPLLNDDESLIADYTWNVGPTVLSSESPSEGEIFDQVGRKVVEGA